MEPAQIIVAVLGSSGIGAAIVALVQGLIKWKSGAAAREKERNTSIAAQRTKAIEDREAAFLERDDEAARRRKADEYSSTLRRILIENGLKPPPWYHDHSTEKENGNGRG